MPTFIIRDMLCRSIFDQPALDSSLHRRILEKMYDIYMRSDKGTAR